MRYLCKLTVPGSAPGAGWREDILVPLTLDGIKLAEWWKTASEEDRVAVLGSIEKDGLIGAWKKVAADIVEPPTEKSEHDRKSTIARAEQANEDMGDPSNMDEPPVVNDSLKSS